MNGRSAAGTMTDPSACWWFSRMATIHRVLFIVVNVFGAKLLAGVIGQQIGAPVSISRLNVGLSGLGIYGFKIGNPEGFGFQEKNVAMVMIF